MIEQIQLTTEINGAVQQVEVTYAYYGSHNIDIHNVQTEAGYHLEPEDLTGREMGTLKSSIRNHKLQAVAV